jgi:hypothetical protein
MHKNFYEGVATAGDISYAPSQVEKLVESVREAMKLQ